MGNRLFILLILLGFCGLCHADTLTLKDGRRIEGKVIYEAVEYVTVEFGNSGDCSMISNFMREDIVNIEKKDEVITDQAVGQEVTYLSGSSTGGDVDKVTDELGRGALLAGMTKKEVLTAAGAPEHVSKSESNGAFNERWTYISKTKKVCLFFENGVLKSWEQ